jgi:UDP-4-amino-4-deoxy-L-arabinose-oxoglutarate aminotransferase
MFRGAESPAQGAVVIPHSRPWITPDDERAVVETMRSEMIGQAQTTARFESALSQWIGSRHPGVAVGSGSAALHLALTALDLRNGDEVIVPTYACRSVLDAVQAVGARPVVADVGPNWVLTPANVAERVTSRTAAIVVAHMYGIFADVDAFRQFGTPLIEDCAQAIGWCREWPVSGDIGVFSFQATKCLTTGEGGMALATGPALSERLRALRDGDEGPRRSFAPMPNYVAALGLSQLSRYTKTLSRRSAIAEVYRRALGSAGDLLLRRVPWNRTMHYRFPLSVERGVDGIARAFAAGGVTVRRGIQELLHRVVGQPDSDYPCATELFDTTACMPIYPALSDDEVRVIANALTALSIQRRAA